jgi:hypothetical protein
LLLNFFYPLRAHRAGLCPGFATDDHPVDTSKIKNANILEQWLNR